MNQIWIKPNMGVFQKVCVEGERWLCVLSAEMLCFPNRKMSEHDRKYI